MILNISSITYYPSTISLKKKNFSSWKQHLGVPINIFRYLSPIIRSPGFSGSSIVKSFPLPKMCSWASAMGVVGCRSTSSREDVNLSRGDWKQSAMKPMGVSLIILSYYLSIPINTDSDGGSRFMEVLN